MNRVKTVSLLTLTVLIVTAIVGCKESEKSLSSTGQTTRPEGWSDETHGNNVEPNYQIVFPDDRVNQIKITIEPDDWEDMQANMNQLFGTKVTEQDNGALPDTRIGRLPGWLDMSPENPMWVPATIEFNGLTWTYVGIRYKGNSSLTSSWRNDILKMPFKIDFDEFEDEYPATDNQRFYGFKQLSFSNAFKDSTYMRDVISADLLADAGLVSAETAYYEVVLDFGDGPINLGLYVAIEVIDDTVIDRYFGDDAGNIYEGDGPGVSLAKGTFNQIQNSFLKENNLTQADWSDIEELYNTLHSAERISDPETWRQNLESVFDVDVFLEWLSISAIIQHWDTYGYMTHNFYLYHDPDTDLLTWISWDHNEVLGIGGGGRRAATAGISFFSKEEVEKNWPLIRYLLDDPVYYSRYVGYIAETIDSFFDPDDMREKCQELSELITPYISKYGDEDTFELAVKELIDRINERYQMVNDFLAEENQSG